MAYQQSKKMKVESVLDYIECIVDRAIKDKDKKTRIELDRTMRMAFSGMLNGVVPSTIKDSLHNFDEVLNVDFSGGAGSIVLYITYMYSD